MKYNFPGRRDVMGSSMVKRRKEIIATFKCQGSGNCCRYPGYVYVERHDIEAMAKQLEMLGIDFRRDYVVRSEGWDAVSTPTFRPQCFLDEESRCKVYEQRPKACRTYPDWDHIWSSEELLMKEIRHCPGLAKAFE